MRWSSKHFGTPRASLEKLSHIGPHVPQQFKFTCRSCGEIHEGAPSFSFAEPFQYSSLTDDQKKSLAKIDSDTCVIQEEDQIDHFIRVVLEIPISDLESPFLWGVWISVSEESFGKYVENYRSGTYTDNYFGWLCNRLPCYPDTLSLKTNALVQPGGQRPNLTLEETEHPLSRDFRNGITWDRAIDIATVAMHGRN